jgi:hypothetical protein
VASAWWWRALVKWSAPEERLPGHRPDQASHRLPIALRFRRVERLPLLSRENRSDVLLGGVPDEHDRQHGLPQRLLPVAVEVREALPGLQGDGAVGRSGTLRRSTLKSDASGKASPRKSQIVVRRCLPSTIA